jgi:hypothetical protein
MQLNSNSNNNNNNINKNKNTLIQVRSEMSKFTALFRDLLSVRLRLKFVSEFIG